MIFTVINAKSPDADLVLLSSAKPPPIQQVANDDGFVELGFCSSWNDFNFQLPFQPKVVPVGKSDSALDLKVDMDFAELLPDSNRAFSVAQRQFIQFLPAFI